MELEDGVDVAVTAAWVLVATNEEVTEFPALSYATTGNSLAPTAKLTVA